MHELSIAQSICEGVIAHAAGRRVETMVIEVGTLSGVNRESLEFVMPDAAEICGLELDGFGIEHWSEKGEDGETALGEAHHFHLIDIVAVRGDTPDTDVVG